MKSFDPLQVWRGFRAKYWLIDDGLKHLPDFVWWAEKTSNLWCESSVTSILTKVTIWWYLYVRSDAKVCSGSIVNILIFFNMWDRALQNEPLNTGVLSQSLQKADNSFFCSDCFSSTVFVQWYCFCDIAVLRAARSRFIHFDLRAARTIILGSAWWTDFCINVLNRNALRKEVEHTFFPWILK